MSEIAQPNVKANEDLYLPFSENNQQRSHADNESETPTERLAPKEFKNFSWWKMREGAGQKRPWH